MKYNRECVILVGVPASGKSTFYYQNFYNTHLHISLDVLSHKNREKAIFEKCLDVTQSVVIDNINLFKADRERYIKLAKSKKYKCICYFFDLDFSGCIARNKKRDSRKRVAIPCISRRYECMEPPSLDEGFDEIYTVKIDKDGNFIVDGLMEQINKINVACRNLSFLISDCIDWPSLLSCMSNRFDVGINLESATISESVVKIECLGEIDNLTRFSIEAQKEINKALSKAKKVCFAKGYVDFWRWSDKESKIKKMAYENGLNIKTDKCLGLIRNTLFYEVEGIADLVDDFVNRISQ